MLDYKQRQKLYIMKNSLNLHKIGISVNPSERANTIKLNSGVKTEVVMVFETGQWFAEEIEKYLHEVFKEKRWEGEWFKLSKTDLKSIEKTRIPKFKVNYTKSIKNRISGIIYNTDINVVKENLIKLPCIDSKEEDLFKLLCEKDDSYKRSFRIIRFLKRAGLHTYRDVFKKYPNSYIVFSKGIMGQKEIMSASGLCSDYRWDLDIKDYISISDTNVPINGSSAWCNEIGIGNWYLDSEVLRCHSEGLMKGLNKNIKSYEALLNDLISSKEKLMELIS